MDALVQWDAVAATDVVAYKVWHGYEAGNYFEFFTVTAPTTQKSLTGLDDFKTHHFAVTAYDNATPPNECDKSANVSKRVAHRFTLR